MLPNQININGRHNIFFNKKQDYKFTMDIENGTSPRALPMQTLMKIDQDKKGRSECQKRVDMKRGKVARKKKFQRHRYIIIGIFLYFGHRGRNSYS